MVATETPQTPAANSVTAPTRPLVVSVPDLRLLDAIRALPEPGFTDTQVEFIEWDLRTTAPRDEIDLVVIGFIGKDHPLANLGEVRTRLVQSQSIGYDHITARLPSGHTLANAATVHETATAELAVGLIIASQRGFAGFIRAQDAAHWNREVSPFLSVADATVLLLGYGGVNKAVDARLAGFETARVVRIATGPRDEPGPDGSPVHVHGMSELPELLPQADIVCVAVPLSPATHHLVSEELLSALRDGSLVVNVARGAVADTDAILRHARLGRLRFALDVTDPEPLPDGHPLFTAPNVLISPHIGGASPAMAPRLARLVARQIVHLLRDEPAENVVFRS